MRTALLGLLFAVSAAVLLTAPAESDCLVDYAIWNNYALGGLTTPWERSELTLAGNYAYRVQANTGLSYPPPVPAVYVIDISDPSYPQVATTIAYGSQPSGVAVSGNYAYVTDKTGSLRVFDVSNLPNPPTPLGSVSLPAPTAPLVQLAVSGSFVYVPDSGAGLQVIDVSDPNTPAIVGSVSAPADRPFFYVIVSGTYAYVSGWSRFGGQVGSYSSGLRIIDISNPASPFVVGSIDNDGAMKVLAVLGSYLYVADFGGIRIIDISNPTTPSILSTFNTLGGAGDLAFFNNIAYVAGGTLLSVFDVSNPTAPRLIGGATGTIWTVEASDSLVYTAGGDSFSIYPIQCPGYVPPPLPVPISASLIRTWGASWGTEPGQFKNPSSLAIDGDQVIYVSDQYNHRIQKFDSTGVFVGMWGTQGPGPGQLSTPRGIDIGADGLVYVADQDNRRVSVFTRDGSFVRTLTDDTDPYYLASPNGLDCEPSGNLWVTDEFGLHHLSSTGEVLEVISIDPGNGAADPTVITADDDTLYVSFCTASRLDKYTLGPSSQPPFTKTSFLGRDLNCPEGSTLDAVGNIWICDSNHSRVLKYNSSGAWIGTVQVPGTPTDIAFDSKGDLYVADENRSTISKYALDTPLTDVVLSSFQASSEAGGILLEWTTSSEQDFAGFHVHRSMQRGTGYRQINPKLLAPPSPYRFLDEDVTSGITYFYRLEAIDRSGDRTFFGPIWTTAGVLSARLEQNRPNPFMGDITVIPFSLPKYGEVKLRILDLSGRQVRLLANERMSPGERQVFWDGKNDRGEAVSAGVYVYDLTASGFRATRRLVRIR